MDFQGALRARALADTTVSGMINDRAYWVQRVQSEGVPAIVFNIVSDPRPQHLKGFNDLRETSFQADCLGSTSIEASELGEALIAALAPAVTAHGIIFNRAMITDVRGGGNTSGETFIHRTSVDFAVWWQSAENLP